LLAANVRRSLDKQNPQPGQYINHEGGFRSMNIPSLPYGVIPPLGKFRLIRGPKATVPKPAPPAGRSIPADCPAWRSPASQPAIIR
jgi:hypothetical protein